MFFGFYPKEQQLNRTLPPGMFDAGLHGVDSRVVGGIV